MAHLHIPDGVLPVVVWAAGWLLAVLLLAVSLYRTRRASPQQISYQGALGALVVAAMAIEVALGPFELHLTLLGPIGVLLGPAGAFQVLFIASTLLAFMGHGGLTVIGLNAVVLGAGAAIARPAYRAIVRARPPHEAMAMATALAQTGAGLLWLGFVVAAVQARAGTGEARSAVLAGLTLPVWVLAVVTETLVALGIGRFLARVRPDLLPQPDARDRGTTAHTR